MDAEAEKPGKNFRVWSFDRFRRKGVVARTFSEFLEKCRQKFDAVEEEVKIVLNECGTEVDGEYFNVLHGGEVLLLLRSDEIWIPEPSTSSSNFAEATGAEGGISRNAQRRNERGELSSEVLNLIDRIGQKKRKHNEAVLEKRRNNVKATFGWFHFSYGKRKYCQVRSTGSQETGGTFECTLGIQDDYDYILNKATSVFFPRGRSTKGRLSRMDYQLGTSKAESIPREGFSLHNYMEASDKQKLRIYLLTKTKIMMDLLDSDDDDLPSATFLNTFQAQVTNLAESQATWTQPGPSTPATNFATSGVPVTQSLQPVQPTVTNFHHVDAGTPTVTIRVADDKCVICCDRIKSSFFIPCGHKCCTVCGVQIESTSHACPFCRTEVTGLGTIKD